MTPEHLKSILHYDPETGILTHKRFQRVTGTPRPDGYLHIHLLGKSWLAHRLIWLYVTGEFPENQIDHINCNPADNRWKNLRLANHRQNRANSRVNKGTASGLKGAYQRGNRWQAAIGYGGKKRHLGYYATPGEAHIAYCKAADFLFGEFSRHE